MTFTGTMPIFSNGIGDIVRLRSDKEMLGIDAQGLIAPMEHEEPWRDGTDEEFIGDV